MTVAAIDRHDPAAELVRWATIANAAAALAERICDTDFVPEAMRGNAAMVTAAIMYGDELGIGPMQALAGINVIKGKPSPSSELQRALVYRAGHTLRVLASDGTKCRLAGRRKDERDETVLEWNIDMARAAGLLDNNPTWRRYPRAMLLARATSELCGAKFADVVKGLTLAADGDLFNAVEVEAWAGVETGEPPPETRTATVARKPREIGAHGAGQAARDVRPVRDMPLPTEPLPQNPPRDAMGEPERLEGWPDGISQPPLPLSEPTGRLEPEAGGSSDPPVSTPPVSAPEPTVPPNVISAESAPGERMLATVHKLFTDLGVGADDRPLKLAIASAAIGRRIESTKHMTRLEGLALVRVLNDMAVGVLSFAVKPDGTVEIYTREDEPT